jgi:hypothetical protein
VSGGLPPSLVMRMALCARPLNELAKSYNLGELQCGESDDFEISGVMVQVQKNRARAMILW